MVLIDYWLIYCFVGGLLGLGHTVVDLLTSFG